MWRATHVPCGPKKLMGQLFWMPIKSSMADIIDIGIKSSHVLENSIDVLALHKSQRRDSGAWKRQPTYYPVRNRRLGSRNWCPGFRAQKFHHINTLADCRYHVKKVIELSTVLILPSTILPAIPKPRRKDREGGDPLISRSRGVHHVYGSVQNFDEQENGGASTTQIFLKRMFQTNSQKRIIRVRRYNPESR